MRYFPKERVCDAIRERVREHWDGVEFDLQTQVMGRAYWALLDFEDMLVSALDITTWDPGTVDCAVQQKINA